MPQAVHQLLQGLCYQDPGPEGLHTPLLVPGMDPASPPHLQRQCLERSILSFRQPLRLGWEAIPRLFRARPAAADYILFLPDLNADSRLLAYSLAFRPTPDGWQLRQRLPMHTLQACPRRPCM